MNNWLIIGSVLFSLFCLALSGSSEEEEGADRKESASWESSEEGQVQSAAVKGSLLCNGKPSAGNKVELIEKSSKFLSNKKRLPIE